MAEKAKALGSNGDNKNKPAEANNKLNKGTEVSIMEIIRYFHSWGDTPIIPYSFILINFFNFIANFNVVFIFRL